MTRRAPVAVAEAPHDLDTEEGVLGAPLAAAELGDAAAPVLATITARLRVDDFYTDAHRAIFDAMLAVHATGRVVDRVTVAAELDARGALQLAGGTPKLEMLTEHGLIPPLVAQRADVVRELARKRELIQIGTRIVVGAQNGHTSGAVIDDIEAALGPLRASSASEPEFARAGLDLAISWPNGARFELTAIRDGREGVRGELTVTLGARYLSRGGAFSLSSTQAREALRKKLEARAPGLAWGEYLEEACFRMSAAVREGEPPVDVATYPAAAGPVCVMPGLMYRGEPSEIHADSDSLKSMTGDALLVSISTDTALPFGLKPAITGPTDYYDWETNEAVHVDRMRRVARGLGVDLRPGAITYKRMKRPLVDVAGHLAADAHRRGVVAVVIDSMVFALAGGEGGFHEPITGFYNALRLFDRMGVLVMNHVTSSDARGGGAARPYGGMFAFAGPRLVWEAKRDREATDGAVVTFTNTKANSHPRTFDPFGLRFVPGADSITIYPADLRESAHALPAASLSYHVRLALARGVEDPETIVRDLKEIGKAASAETIKRLLRMERQRSRDREP